VLNIVEYMESGVLQQYCLGLLPADERKQVEQVCLQYPVVKQELSAIASSLETFAGVSAMQPPAFMKDQIWNTLQNIGKEKEGSLDDLPLINKYSDHNNWKRIVLPLIPTVIKKEDTLVKVLRQSGGVTQVLMISGTEVPDEVHEDEYESFIVLEGECECQIGDNVIRLGPGGFIDIPLHTHHHVTAISEYVIAVMQRVAV
jgi:quercetin dioxygenase-like cupin family protein